MKRVLVLSGPSGSGKSTWIATHHPEAIVCSADNFFTDDQGNYNFNPKLLAHAHSDCMKSFLINLQREEGLIAVDNTNLKQWERQNYILAARFSGWEIEVVFFKVRTLEQVENCAARNRHGVPIEVIATMAIDHECKVYGPVSSRFVSV